MPEQSAARELVAAGWRLIQANDFPAAIAPLRQACELDPREPAAQFLRGACHHALGQLPQALAAFDLALAADPGHRDAALGAIAVLCQLGRPAEARPRCERLIAAAPQDANAHFTAGFVHEACGDLAAALASYDAALERDPGFRPAMLNRGLALARLGRFVEAYENNRAAAAAFPAEPDSHFNLAEASLALSRYAEALEYCARALQLAPRHVGALFDRGLALASLGRIDEAEASFAAARAVDPGAVRALEARAGGIDARALAARDVFVIRGFEALNACDWSQRTAYLEQFAALIGDQAAHPLVDQAACFRAIAAGLAPTLQREIAEGIATVLTRDIKPLPPVAPRPGARLRIGYLSPDFRDHPVGFLTQSLFEQHDRRAVEVFAYALSPEAASPVRRRVVAGADTFRDLSSVPTDEAARQIRTDGIDVLVDLAGHTDGSRPALLARRPAAVAMAYLGFPGTTGARYVDYYVADRVTAPSGTDALFTECLVRLPHTFWVHDAPVDVAPAPSRTALGLPDGAVVLCAFHNGYKIGPDAFDAWMAVLRAAPGAALWLLDGGEVMRANLLREAGIRGVAADRIRFAPRVPRAENLARLACADLFLDAFHYNAGANALDALWAGVPVVTAPGPAFAARMGASAVLAAGLPELVTDSPAAYVRRVLELVGDSRERRRFRARLAEARSSAPLFDVAARARELEAAFAQAIERAATGLPPAPLDVVVSRQDRAGR